MLCHHVHCGGCCWRSEINFSRCSAKRGTPSLPLHLTPEFMHYGDRGVSTIATITRSLFGLLSMCWASCTVYTAYSIIRVADDSALAWASPSAMRPYTFNDRIASDAKEHRIQTFQNRDEHIPLLPSFHVHLIGWFITYYFYFYFFLYCINGGYN